MNNFTISIISVFLLTSCASTTVEVKLLKSDPKSIYSKDESFRNIEVIDDRISKKIIGTKEYSDEDVDIINNQNLANLIKYEIIRNLKKDNKFIDQDSTLKITIKDLTYNSRVGLFIGESKVTATLEASLTNNKNIKYRKIYNLENERTHFIISLKKTDQKIINSILRDAIDQAFKEKILQEILN